MRDIIESEYIMAGNLESRGILIGSIYDGEKSSSFWKDLNFTHSCFLWIYYRMIILELYIILDKELIKGKFR